MESGALVLSLLFFHFSVGINFPLRPGPRDRVYAATKAKGGSRMFCVKQTALGIPGQVLGKMNQVDLISKPLLHLRPGRGVRGEEHLSASQKEAPCRAIPESQSHAP